MLWTPGRIKLSYSLIGLFLIATTLLGVMLLVNNYHFIEQLVKQTTYRNLALVSDKQLDFINVWIQERQRDMINLADSRVVRSRNRLGMENLFKEFHQRSGEYEGIAFAGLDGKTLTDTVGMPGLDVHEQPYFRKGLEGREFVSDVLISPASGKPVIIFSAPVWSEGNIVGVVQGSVRLNRLNEIMSFTHEHRALKTYLVNKEGYMITESWHREKLSSNGRIKDTAVLELELQTAGIRQALLGKTITGEFTDYMGEQVLGAYRWLPDRQWVLVAELNRAEIMGSVKEYQSSAVWASLAVIFLGFIPIGVVFAFSITGPITRLRNMVNVISQGNWDQRVRVESFQEIAALAETFNQMAEKIEKSEEEIQAKQAELLEKNRLLEQLATTDPLTQVYNRRYILGRLPSELAHAVRYGEKLSTIMIDLDHFKKVNDTYGHSVGDQALLGVVEVINQTIRKADIMGRWGGEEFIVICPNTGREAAAALAERIRQRVEEAEFTTAEGIRIPLSISMGVAEFCLKFPEVFQDTEDMIIRADKALYKAKNSGRNKVVMDTEGG